MSDATVPESVLPLLTTNKVAVVATVRPDGQPATATVWVDWDGQQVLFSSKVGSRKGRNLRVNPYVAIHVVDPGSGSWLQVRGEVTEIRPDEDLAFIDRLSERYKGGRYAVRDFEREIFTVVPQHVLFSIR